jgi:excisionase family DNA binding protein
MDASFQDMTFYTAQEVAEKLTMNRQVIVRKMQSGEIKAYKIGKEWRVEEEDLQDWLDRQSNRRPRLGEEDLILKNFFKNGRLLGIPAKRKKRLVVLKKMLEEFEPRRVYTELEVNRILRKFDDDVATIRRLFVDNGMMFRSEGKYMRQT